MDPALPSGRRVGYARVSTDDQNLSLQFDAPAQRGVSMDLIFSDKRSGAKDDRPGLARCLKTLQAGDTLIVWSPGPWRPTSPGGRGDREASVCDIVSSNNANGRARHGGSGRHAILPFDNARQAWAAPIRLDPA